MSKRSENDGQATTMTGGKVQESEQGGEGVLNGDTKGVEWKPNGQVG